MSRYNFFPFSPDPPLRFAAKWVLMVPFSHPNLYLGNSFATPRPDENGRRMAAFFKYLIQKVTESGNIALLETMYNDDLMKGDVKCTSHTRLWILLENNDVSCF